MNVITVGISPMVTAEQQQDPLFKQAHEAATRFFNSPYHFTKKFRDLLCLHEAGHIVYARLAGATNIQFHGPTMRVCSGCPDPNCERNPFSVSKSSVSWTWPPNVDVTAAMKTDIGGITFREVLSDTPNDAASVWSDINGARKLFHKHVGPDEDAFQASVAIARAEIIKDLRAPAFRRLAWDTAREFQQAIFPPPKHTAATPRFERLGWAQLM